MKINLVSAIMRGDEYFTNNVVTPSAWAVYYKIVVNLNRLGWKSYDLDTTLTALSHGTHLRPTNVRTALRELINLTLIDVQGDIDSTSTQHRLNITLLPKEPRDAILSKKSTRKHASTHDMHDSLAAMHTDNAYRQPDTTDTQKISERAKKLLKQLKEYHFFDDDITYQEKELLIKEKILINCIATDINNIAKGEMCNMSVTSERLLKEHRLNARHFIETYM